MGLDACFDREESILNKQLERGEITQREYDAAIRELELEYGDHLRSLGYN